ncbi:coatomer subunit gamma [Histomonas meleagridis]|uniref:coatomer subunit gamma n=1 Tax=Histomonas meleagridis TaxID=135588 RepID=UPI0035599DEA|nr:coatomer subunit gamma [Histomonas meleagridis]KAH0802539.1 coatomer subunit gamma [Histomonas meleagridis]
MPKGGASKERKEISTTTVVSRCRAFRDVTLNLPRCRSAMISILQAIAQNVEFTEKERTEIFFSLTQLFHSQDTYIHRLLILLLKEIPVNTHDSIIITHSLSKDIGGTQALPQGHAIRCLCAILEPNNVLSLERYLKLSIISQVPYTSSAALLGALHLIEGGRKDAVLRWLPEIRQASKSTNRATRFHALLLLYALKSEDGYASAQLASSLEDPKTQLEQYISIAIASQSLKVKSNPSVVEYLKRCMTTGSPIVRLEALRRSPEELSSISVEVLSYLLRGTNIKCFSAVRTIANSNNIQQYTSLLPQIISLMKSPNTSLAANASICVLKLGDESHVDLITKRILKSCRKWAAPLLRAVAEESCKFASKYHNERLTDVSVFLLRVASDLPSKFSILRSLLTTEGIPRKHLLPRLSEYLEDWDAVSIARIICDFIGKECKQMEDPSSLIPVLFNRINLDVSSVRMAAVNTLAMIAYSHGNEIKQKIIPLLELFQTDEDDSLREEVILFLNALKNNIDMSSMFTDFIIECKEEKSSEVITNNENNENVVISEGFIPVSMNPEFEKYGKIEYKSDSFDVTDSDSDFVVSYFVNVFPKVIVLEFICTNTIEDVNITNVSVFLDGIDVIETTEADSIKFKETGSMCCILNRKNSMIFGRYRALLVYSQEDETDKDQWELNEVVLGINTWFRSQKINQYEELYASMAQSEVVSVFQVQNARNTAQGIERVEAEIRLYKVMEEKDSKKTTILFYGKDIKDKNLFVLVQLGIARGKGVVCRIAIRSESKDLSEEIMQTLSF